MGKLPANCHNNLLCFQSRKTIKAVFIFRIVGGVKQEMMSLRYTTEKCTGLNKRKSLIYFELPYLATRCIHVKIL